MKAEVIFLLHLLLICSAFAQTQPPNNSSTITKLETAVAQSGQKAVEDFWKDVKLKGTPLIEPIENDKKNSLVTFFWRGDAETKNVLVQSPMFPWMMVRRQMARVENTDVWYKTVVVPNDARFSYQFSINDPRLPFADPSDWNKFQVKFVNDSLNPKKFVFPKDAENAEDAETVVSLLEMPSAFKSPFSNYRENIPRGKIEKHQLKSRILKNERRVWIYTPPKFSPSKKYPLLVFTDGWDYQSLIPTPAILDNLQAENKIAPAVAVFVDLPHDDVSVRNRELSCNPDFSAFVVKELLPFVESKYKIAADPQQRTIGGISLGGLAAGCIALNHSDVFGNVLMQSPSMWWGPENYAEDGEWLTHQFTKAKKLPLRFYIDVGKYEVFPSTRQGRPIQLHAVRHLRDVLRLKGNHVIYTEFDGAHEYMNWRETLPEALIKILSK